MDQKAVYRGGKKVGVVQNGSYQVVDENGHTHAGTFAKLIQQHVAAKLTKGAGPNGKFRFDGQTAEVVGGSVFLKGQRVGSIDASGRYTLELDGARSGDAHSTPGAVFIGAGGGTGVISIAGLTLVATDGRIHDGAELVGWLQSNGRFRAVRNNGDYLEGTVGQPSTFRFLKRQRGK